MDLIIYIKATIDYVKYLVQDIEKQQLIKGRTIPTDCLYTSFNLANWLLARETTTVGILQKEKQTIPSDRDEVSAIC